MRAVEYFAMYDAQIMSKNKEEALLATGKLVQALMRDAAKLIEVRNVKTTRGVVSIGKELYKKWNAICRLFEEKYSYPVLKRNGFMDIFNSWVMRGGENSTDEKS